MLGCFGRNLESERWLSGRRHWGQGNCCQGLQEPRGRRKQVVCSLDDVWEERVGVGRQVLVFPPVSGCFCRWGSSWVSRY